MKMLVSALEALCLLSVMDSFSAFNLPSHRMAPQAFSSSPSLGRQPSLFRTNMSNEQETNGVSSETEKILQQARRMKLEAERLEAQLTLEKITKLEKALKVVVNDDAMSEDDLKKKQMSIKEEMKILASKVDPSLLPSMSSLSSTDNTDQPAIADGSIKPVVETNLYKDGLDGLKKRILKPTITEKELTDGAEYFSSLPEPMQRALAEAVELDAVNTAPAIIVLSLYEARGKLDEDTLRKLYQDAIDGKLRTLERKETLDVSKFVAEGEVDNPFQAWSSGDGQLLNALVDFLPSVAKKEGTGPTEADAVFLTENILGKDTFQASQKPQEIVGGYIIKGSMVSKLKDDADELIRALDEKIEKASPEWFEKFQVSYICTPTAVEEGDDMVALVDDEPLLLVSSKDMGPMTNQFLSSGTTFVSLFFSLVFAVATFGNNNVVMTRLTEANQAGDFDIAWFNELLYPFIIAVGVSQAFHEAAHLFVAKKDNFKISPPTVLPLIALPYLTFKTNIKTSPKNHSSLFNFAAAGPLFGMIVSFLFFIVGLQLTLTMDSTALEYAPSIPVAFLRLSSLGGNIVDYVIGGGNGIILNQDPSTAVQLHPLAIGGLASLMIQALDTIPIAATDGGRMSQSLLGRTNHTAFSGLITFGLLGYVVLSDHKDIFLTYLLLNSFVQKDLEIPMRNEVDNAGLGQVSVALVMWSVAILTLVPV